MAKHRTLAGVEDLVALCDVACDPPRQIVRAAARCKLLELPLELAGQVGMVRCMGGPYAIRADIAERVHANPVKLTKQLSDLYVNVGQLLRVQGGETSV